MHREAAHSSRTHSNTTHSNTTHGNATGGNATGSGTTHSDAFARNITVAVDADPSGLSALAWAEEEAATTGAALTVLCAEPEPPGGPGVAALELADPVVARAVHRVRERLGGHNVTLSFAGREPDPPPDSSDLLVVGAPPAPERPWPMIQRLTATASMPVVVVRPLAGHGGGELAGHVAVGVAGGCGDPIVADLGFRYAAEHGLPLAVVHVSEEAANDFWFDEQTLETHFYAEPPQLTMLAAVVEPLMMRYPRVPVKTVALAGRPAERLPKACVGARLLIVGRRQHRLLARILGSVSQSVVATAHGPVAVVPVDWRHPDCQRDADDPAKEEKWTT